MKATVLKALAALETAAGAWQSQLEEKAGDSENDAVIERCESKIEAIEALTDACDEFRGEIESD